MNERVEEIRRQAVALHNELGRIFSTAPAIPAVDDRMVAAIEAAMLTALAQAERTIAEVKVSSAEGWKEVAHWQKRAREQDQKLAQAERDQNDLIVKLAQAEQEVRYWQKIAADQREHIGASGIAYLEHLRAALTQAEREREEIHFEYTKQQTQLADVRAALVRLLACGDYTTAEEGVAARQQARAALEGRG